MHDLLIVGGGCAGCSAAITARQRNLSVLVIYSGGGDLAKAAWVNNYPGMPNASGEAIISAFRQQAQDMGATLVHQLVQRVMPVGKGFSVLAGNEVYEARAVLLAPGITRINPLAGEEELLGQGVSYCATCDGMFYKGKDILVVAGGVEAVEEANYLSDLGRVSYFSQRTHSMAGLSDTIAVYSDKPKAIAQEGQQLRLHTDTGSYLADGIFVVRPVMALTQLLPELTVQKGFIPVDGAMMTRVPGVFAAGDIIGTPLQAAKAVGEGNVAALSIAQYLKRSERLGSPA